MTQIGTSKTSHSPRTLMAYQVRRIFKLSNFDPWFCPLLKRCPFHLWHVGHCFVYPGLFIYLPTRNTDRINPILPPILRWGKKIFSDHYILINVVKRHQSNFEQQRITMVSGNLSGGPPPEPHLLKNSSGFEPLKTKNYPEILSIWMSVMQDGVAFQIGNCMSRGRPFEFWSQNPTCGAANRNSRCQLAHVSLLDCEFSNSGSKHGSRSLWFNEFPPDDVCCFFHAVFHIPWYRVGQITSKW